MHSEGVVRHMTTRGTHAKEAHWDEPRQTSSFAMHRAHQDGSRSSDHDEGASRFAALVRCSVQEAQEWLCKSAGSIEAALDSYLAQERSSKRHKTNAASPRPCSPSLNSAFSPVEVDFAPRKSATVWKRHSETSRRASPDFFGPGGQAKVQAGRETPSGNTELLIDLVDDSGEEDGNLTSETKVCDPRKTAGKFGCADEVPPPEPAKGPPAPAVDDLPDDFSFFLGKCVASGTVTSGTMSKLSLTDPLTLMVEVRLPHTQRWGPQQGSRRAKVSNSGYRILYIHLDDPVLLEHQRRLGQPNLRSRRPDESPLFSCGSSNAVGGKKAAKGSNRCSPLAGLDFHNLLSSISEQTTFLRLLIDDREAVRFDREVASALAPLLLLGAIKVDVCWLPDKMPPRRLAINSTLSVRMTVHMTIQALRLSALRQRGDPYLSQVHFPLLIGQAFESLLHLLALQPVPAGSLLPEEERDANVLGPDEEAEVRKSLDSLSRPKGPSGSSLTGKEDTRGASERSLQGASRAFNREEERGEVSEGTDVFDEDEEYAERSDALCQLVLKDRAESANLQREQQRRRRLGSLYPPASMFASRLRPYQAQGLWWMLQCESEQSLRLEDEDEELDPLWAKYDLPSAAAAYGTMHGPTLVPAPSSDCKRARTFVPRCFYLNTSSGLVSLEKPSTTGRVRGGILADCMGLGKTVQVLALIAVSEYQERDPAGAAIWLAASVGGCAHDTGAASRTSSAAKPVSSPDELTGAAARQWDAFASSQLSASPISVSSDGDGADLNRGRGQPIPSGGRNSLLAVDPHTLQRTLKRGRDNLLQGGTLIVVPLSLIGQWYAEVQRHLARGVATVLQYYGPARPRDPKVLAAYTIVLTSYQTLASDFRHLSKHIQAEKGTLHCEPHSAHTLELGCVPESPIASIRFRRVILDEGHIIKNTSSLVNRACNSVEADSRWVLTGTPLQNDLSDAFALVQFLRVSPMGSRRWWRAKVTQAMERGMVRAAVETVRSILVPLMLRRHGDQIGEDGKPLLPLPPLTIHTFTLQLTYEERLFYQTIFEHSKAKFDQLVQSGQVLQHYTHVLQLLLRLRQACNHPLLPSHREQQRRQQFIDLICPAQDPLKCRSRDALGGLTSPSPPPRPAPDPILQKYIQDAVEGKLEDCPICLEPPTDAVVLTNCWHVLCVTCVLLLQSNSNGAAAACPTCRSKFLHQHVRLLPSGPKASAQRWIQVVQKKHREALAAADEAGSKDGKQTGAQQAPSGERECFSSVLNAACPTEDSSTDLHISAAKYEGALLAISDDTFFFSTKMRLLLALLEADVTAGRSCVIFSQWTSMLDLLEMAFARVEAVRSAVQPRVSGARNDDNDDDDDVVEMGATSAERDTPHFPTGKLNNEVRRGEYLLSAQQEAPTKRLYNYRRIDGTLGLEARQRTIQWFSDDNLRSMSPKVGSCTSRATEAEVEPFMGQFNLQPFACASDPTGDWHREGGPPLKQFGATKSTMGNKGGEDRLSSQHGKILLLSLKTGNVGLNLVKATRCYLIDGWWNPQVEKQAMRRLWRYGQDQPVSVYRFVCARTVEERMEELMEWKGRLSRTTLRSADGFEQERPADPEAGDADKRRGRLSLQDLKKLFEGWEAGSVPT